MEPNTTDKESAWLATGKYRYGLLLFIGIALFLRIHHYLGNRSLWIDEAQLALNFVQPPLWKLFQPLMYDQMGPMGFLFIEKLAVGAFGGNEYILRLFPFVAGILSVFLLYRLALKLLGIRIALTALAIFSVSHWAIYYAADVKQYSSDIMVSLILYLATAYALDQWNTRRWLLLTVAGIAGVLLSHPAAFIVAGIGICTGTLFLLRRQWIEVLRLVTSSVAWLASFAFGLYATAAIGSASAESAKTLSNMTSIFWHRAFAPFPPTSISDIRWYWSAFIDFFDAPLGFGLQGLAALLFVTGLLFLWKNNRIWAGLFAAPILVALGASAFHLYPFSTRLLTFLLPGSIIVIAVGVEAMRQITWNRHRAVWFIIVAMLMFQPVINALSNAAQKSPYTREDIRSVLEHVSQSKSGDDKIYIYYGAERAFRYYQPRFDIPMDTVIWGQSARETWDSYLEDVDRLKGLDRVWLVFSHAGDLSGMDEERFLLYFLDKVGTQLESRKTRGASCYLYRFNAETNSSTM